MTQNPSFNAVTLAHKPYLKALAVLLSLAAFGYLLQRNLGLYPNVFADEWYYSKMARLQPLAEAIVPSYLYLWLSGLSNACGDGFYDCVRVGNLLFLFGAAPFVYLTARTVASPLLAGLVALFSLLAPFNIYTAYFMPEAMYYFGFWVLAWLLLTRGHWRWPARAAAAGVVLGLMSLVKVHALFLLPALAVFQLYAAWAHGGRGWLASGVGSAALGAALVFAVKFGLGYALAGEAGLSVFGPFYAGAANAAGGRSILSLLPAAIINGRGHLMVLALLIPLPLALLAQTLLSPPARAAVAPRHLLQLLALLVLGSAAGMTIFYTASIAEPGVTNEGLRLHLRYYSYVFPLLWMVAAAAVGKPLSGTRWQRWLPALLLAAVLAAALFKLGGFSINPVDGPEAHGVNTVRPMGQLVLWLDLAVLLLWACGVRASTTLFVYVALPASLACGAVAVERHLQHLRRAAPADQAGAMARRLIPPAERGQVTVAGSDLQQIMRVQFHLDRRDSGALELPVDAPVAQYQLPMRNKWLIVLGKHALPGGITPLEQTAEVAVVRVDRHFRPLGRAALSAPYGKGLLAGAEGMSYAESWGRWSEGSRVVLHLHQPLPRHALVVLKAQAYDVNTTLPFTMHVGSQSEPFRLGWTPQEVGLRFETDGATRSIAIDVPQPVSPAERGHPNDPRKLGIGIIELEVGEAGAAVPAQ